MDDVCVVAKDVVEVGVPCSATAALSPLADEFVPSCAAESYSLPSIGMQLDCML